jgi:hypothetical protein
MNEYENRFYKGIKAEVEISLPVLDVSRVPVIGDDEVARQTRIWCVLILRRMEPIVSAHPEIAPRLGAHLIVANLGPLSDWSCLMSGLLYDKRIKGYAWGDSSQTVSVCGMPGESYYDLAYRLLDTEGAYTRCLNEGEDQIISRLKSIVRLG